MHSNSQFSHYEVRSYAEFSSWMGKIILMLVIYAMVRFLLLVSVMYCLMSLYVIPFNMWKLDSMWLNPTYPDSTYNVGHYETKEWQAKIEHLNSEFCFVIKEIFLWHWISTYVTKPVYFIWRLMYFQFNVVFFITLTCSPFEWCYPSWLNANVLVAYENFTLQNHNAQPFQAQTIYEVKVHLDPCWTWTWYNFWNMI